MNMCDHINLLSLIVGAIVIAIMLAMFIAGTPARAEGG